MKGDNKMNAITKLRKETGLTQQAFADKYNIPMRTLQAWEGGTSSPSDYVIEMIHKIVKSESFTQMAWIRHEYRDAAGHGSTKYYSTKSEAIKAAQEEWEHLSEADQNTYKNDAAGEFCVSMVEMVWDDTELEYYPDISEMDPVWSAI